MARIPIPNIDFRLTSIPCNNIDLLGPFLLSSIDHVDSTDVFNDLKSYIISNEGVRYLMNIFSI